MTTTGVHSGKIDHNHDAHGAEIVVMAHHDEELHGSKVCVHELTKKPLPQGRGETSP